METQHSKPNRDRRTGQYAHDNKWDRPCRCGHTLGSHAAAVVGGERPCFHGDSTGEPCDCNKFRPAK